MLRIALVLVRARAQVALLLAVVAASFALAGLTQRSPPPPVLEPADAVGGGEEPAAFLVHSGGRTFNLSQLPRCFLFEENETPLLWLGAYRVSGVRTYGNGYTVVVLELEAGSGGAYLVRGLRAPAEVYAVVREPAHLKVIPLFRVVEAGRIVEISGQAEGAAHVRVYAFKAPEDFNSSLPPPPSPLAVAEVTSGRYNIRLEKGGAPYTREGKPLIEVNSTLVLLTDCSYAIVDMSNFTEAKGSVHITVNLSCRRG